MTKLFAPTALIVALSLPAHAVQPAEGETLADSQTYTYWLLDAIKSLDPAKNTDVEGSDVLRQLFEGLMNEDATGAMVPGVAETHQESEDGLTYTFTLRDAKWSNGDPVTAGDFVYAWRRVVNPDTASEYAWFLELMNVANATRIIAGELPPDQLGVRAIDDRTLEVTLSTRTPYFLKTLSHATTFPVPQAVVERLGDAWTQPGNLVGNGAFVLESHNLGVDITLAKNPEYWDAANVALDTVRGVTVNDNNVALTRYLAGELDRVQIPAGQYPRLSQDYPDQAVSIPYACSYAYVFNLSDKGPEALKDVRVRQALSLGLNRDIIVDQVLQGGQKPAYSWTHWAIEGFQSPDADIAGMTQPERTEKAAALLAEAGYGPDSPLALTLQYNTDENHKKLAIAAQQFWKPLGVNITLNNVEWKVHTDRMQSQDFDMARYAWCADYNEASPFLDWFRTDGYNSGKWSNAEYDALMAHSKTAPDTAPLYKRAEEILAEEVPAVFVYHYAKVDMLNPAIKGIPTQNVTNSWYAKGLYRIAE
ncbi:peptide ABC transporter substrate-binding protein [Paracoccus sediminis]|uniref:Oligopeptide transport system substrate-binding protein n=1 Tax=Paracoccus sediminis TaxID=1214787 RepID=A0A238WUB9_9RHOB|nr:peptide ABC transporter substrate-binding protein [Paracoccus sediminis]TBN49989.1 peptide ABC transporter substrate-binding protein [Paracoccus sediminis]SNR50018.1 oligopeptide transport system substrate-binding protein [Paracoccus sediminis]